ncbi:MAG: hypothetical protein R2695_03875 [Acidimicrobiales bacterium]
MFQAALADAGLAGLTYPKEYGGQGLDGVREDLARGVRQVPQHDLRVHHLARHVPADAGRVRHRRPEGQYLADNIRGA